MLRFLATFALGSLIVVGVAGIAAKVFGVRGLPAIADVDDPRDDGEPVAVECPDPATAARPHRFCCVPRAQINPLQIEAVECELARRWLELRTLGREHVTVGDRVAFVVEAGTSAVMREREVLTATVLTEHAGKLLVGLGCAPRLGKQHGLACESLTLVPRESIIAWTNADAPELPAELDRATLSLARFVRPGEPVELVVHTVPGMQWTTEPADVARVDVLELRDGVVTIALRDVRPGRFDVVATAEHPAWGELSLGRWPVVVGNRGETSA